MRKVVLGMLLLSLACAASAEQKPSQATPALLHALKKAVETSTSFHDRYDATVWLLDMSTRMKPMVPNPTSRLHILKAVHREALRAGLSPELVLAVIQVESRFNRYAVSSAGAEGLMQVMPFWLNKIGHPHDNLFHIDTNLRMGCTILRYYLDQSKGDIFEALARYNGSYGRLTYPNLVLKALRTRWYRR